jgi:hypothetical protein
MAKIGKKLALFVQNAAIFCKIWIITLASKKNTIFRQKIGENR